MNIKNSALSLALAVGIGATMTLTSCTKETPAAIKGDGTGIYELAAPKSAIPGHIRIKLKEDLAKSSPTEALDLSSLEGAVAVNTFEVGGRFEKRQREAGLHLWYDIFFNEEQPLTKAANSLVGRDGIAEVEFVCPVKAEAVFPFNDPDFGKQWHYYNPGNSYNLTAGCDINLLPAWEVTTGKNNVIVAISDGGPELTHPDIAANLWRNEAEINGQPGVDDDGNGYVDDFYGYNFVVGDDEMTMVGKLTPDGHGMHVAGTVAAVNNNGIGGCGIAGGDGTPDSGIRLMSTQTSGGSAFIGRAFQYAADNGAVLVNCSWSIDTDSTPASISEAIDYFNKYAGLDELGRQVGPMAGGLCIFAAGNDNGQVSYPAMDSNTLSVAAIGGNFTKAYYSNYGPWVDISAPGGDANEGPQIYSTITGGGWASKQGTSMACPHVTGVAALIVSHYGGPGFTRENLINILKNSANPTIYKHNPNYAGQLGVGMVDAGEALTLGVGTPPVVQEISGSASANIVTLKWNVPSAGEGESKVGSFTLYWSGESLSSLQPDRPEPGVEKIEIPKCWYKEGDEVSVVVETPAFKTPYYFRIVSNGSTGSRSKPSPEIEVVTTENSKPVIKPTRGTHLDLKSADAASLEFEVYDPDGHELSFRLEGDIPGAYQSYYPIEKRALVSINAPDAEEGRTYSGELVASDSYDETRIAFSYSIEKNNPPFAVREFEDLVFNSLSDTRDIREIDYFFKDPDGDLDWLKLSVTVEGDPAPVKFSFEKTVKYESYLHLEAASYGTGKVTVTATDTRGSTASKSFNVVVRNGERLVDLYPNPVRDFLNVRMASRQTADVTISNRVGAVIETLKGTEIDPFAPLRIDMSGYPAGTYYVRVKTATIDESHSVIKQ